MGQRRDLCWNRVPGCSPRVASTESVGGAERSPVRRLRYAIRRAWCHLTGGHVMVETLATTHCVPVFGTSGARWIDITSPSRRYCVKCHS